MLESIRALHPNASLVRIAWRSMIQMFFLAWFSVFYRFKAWGVEHVPQMGSVLLVSNHQSFLDPIIIAIASRQRQFYAMARSTLFKNLFFGWLIRSLNAMPVRRGVADLAALRASIQLLREEQGLLLFPEGTRTTDGFTHPFAKGTMTLVKRAQPVVVPVAIQGAFDVWPKGQSTPKVMGKIAVVFGPPFQAADLIAMGDKRALECIFEKVETMRLEISQRMD